MRGTTRKALAGLAVCAATLGMGAGIASAGEITGNGKPTPIKAQQSPTSPAGPANSICSFSGLNDTPVPGDPFEGRVQNWGSLVKVLGPMGGGPGTACRGGNFEEP